MDYPRNGRTAPATRKRELLKIALKIAERVGFNQVTSVQLAKDARLNSHGLIFYYFGRVDQLHNAIMLEALRTGNTNVILQGVLAKHPAVKEISPEVKEKIIQSIEAAV